MTKQTSPRKLSISGGGFGDAAGEYVSLADYEALEAKLKTAQAEATGQNAKYCLAARDLGTLHSRVGEHCWNYCKRPRSDNCKGCSLIEHRPEGIFK